MNGELRTYGFNGFAGGIFRSVPISFPVAVSFDYRTLSQGECVTGNNDGGWVFTLNGAPVAFSPPYNKDAQVTFVQYHGGGPVVRSYLTANGRVNDTAPGVSPALSGQWH